MNKRDYIRAVCTYMRDNGITKPVSYPKQVFHISDDDGNSKDFVVKKTDKNINFTTDDVAAIVEACIETAKEALRKGDNISLHGFGVLGLNYRQPRKTKEFGTDNDVLIEGRYVPKFSFGNDLRMCAKVYELSLDDRLAEPAPRYDDEEECEDDGSGNES